ncbi:MAG: TIGR01212 family radical SAM protein [Deltaproteobacteria bacterium]|nr:TIGR01212 family radical SAM protein [Deltaproteobacteria bacterium]
MSLDAGFSCPNRDGTKGRQGCAFCDPASFSPAFGDARSVSEQLSEAIVKLTTRGLASKFAAYFQPGANTYAPPEALREAWENAAAFPEVVALCVGTRPDCVPDSVLDLLASYVGRFGEIWLELGLQSAKDETLRRLGRGHTVADFRDACAGARSRGLRVCAHVILGLPGEMPQDEAATAELLAELEVEGVKLHQLAFVEGTRLGEEWRQGLVRAIEEEEYVERAVAFIRRLRPGTVLHRLVGDTAGARLLAPRYDKARVVRAIRAALAGAPVAPLPRG